MGIEEVRIGTATVMFAILVNLRTNVGEQLAVYLVSLLKSGGKDRDRAGETDGGDANPGHPNRDTTPSGCLAFQCGKDAGD